MAYDSEGFKEAVKVDPLTITDPRERLDSSYAKPVWPRLMASHAVDLQTGCWNWTGLKLPAGYGSITVNGRRTTTHRAAYQLFRGPIRDGGHIDHLCRNRACFNPAHLEVVTARENNLRGEGFAAVNARKTHCIRGHEFTVANTDILRGGSRRCRTCQHDRNAAWRAAHPKVKAPVDPLSLTDPRDRLLYLRDFLRDLPPERFNMEYCYQRNGSPVWPDGVGKTAGSLMHNCKTAACVAGWAVSIFTPRARTNTGSSEAANLLGLSIPQASKLFLPVGYHRPDFASAAHAAEVIDGYLRTGSIDWSVARA